MAASVVPEILGFEAGHVIPKPVDNSPSLSTGVDDTPTICGVYKFQETPYIVV
jgi:hypothetical protein